MEKGRGRAKPVILRMLGYPSPDVVANHLFVGIKHLVDFKTNMGFNISAETNQVQKVLNEIAGRHRAWGVRVYPNMWFLNT